MATAIGAAAKADQSGGVKSPSSLGLSYSYDNKPNPDIFLPSLRTAGYTLETALGDLVDNSLDAGASVVAVTVGKAPDGWYVEVADNGTGMDLATLDEMMRLGSRTTHNLESGLGRFGLGSTTASLALGQVQHVVTSYEPGRFASAATDLEEMVRSKEFTKHLADASAEEKEIFAASYRRSGVEVPESGTLVRVMRCDKIDRVQLPQAVRSIKAYLAGTYRYFIWAQKQFYVNGELVDSEDPLERDNPGTDIMLEDAFIYQFPKDHPRAGEEEKFGVILVQLEDRGGPEINKQHGQVLANQGLYVMRNRREIARAQDFRLWTRHHELSQFRGEILFPATMDDDLGVTFLKSAWNIRPTQSLRDKLGQLIVPFVSRSRKIARQHLVKDAEVVPHDEAAKIISQRAPFLRRPMADAEKRATPSGEASAKPSCKPTGQERAAQLPRIQRVPAERAEFVIADLGATGNIFDAQVVTGRKIRITYNSAHPFYQRFVLDNRENRGMVAGIDFLVYSLASAELMASDENSWQLIEAVRETMSFNLRQLLAT